MHLVQDLVLVEKSNSAVRSSPDWVGIVVADRLWRCGLFSVSCVPTSNYWLCFWFSRDQKEWALLHRGSSVAYKKRKYEQLLISHQHTRFLSLVDFSDESLQTVNAIFHVKMEITVKALIRKTVHPLFKKQGLADIDITRVLTHVVNNKRHVFYGFIMKRIFTTLGVKGWAATKETANCNPWIIWTYMLLIKTFYCDARTLQRGKQRSKYWGNRHAITLFTQMIHSFITILFRGATAEPQLCFL